MLSVSQPITLAEDRPYLTAVTDCYVHGEQIYVLYGGKGILKIFDTNGKYLRSYAYHKRNNGAVLYEHEDRIYLYSAEKWILVFENGEYTDRIGYDQWDLMERQLPFRTSATFASEKKKPGYYGELGYTMRLGSVCRAEEDGKTTVVIPRPFGSLVLQGILPWAIMFSCFMYLIVKTNWKQGKKSWSETFRE